MEIVATGPKVESMAALDEPIREIPFVRAKVGIMVAMTAIKKP